MIDEYIFRDIQRTEAYEIEEIMDLIRMGKHALALARLKAMSEEKKWRALEKI